MVLEELFDLSRIRASDNVDLCDAKVSMSKLDKYGRQNFASRGTPFIKKRCRISAEMAINENQIVIHRNQRDVKYDLPRSVSKVDLLNQRCEAENRMLPLREKVKVPSKKILKRETLISPRLRSMTRIRRRPSTIIQRPPTAIVPRPPTVIVPRPPTAVFPRPPTAPRNKTFRRRVNFFSSNNQQLPPLHRHNADLSRRFLWGVKGPRRGRATFSREQDMVGGRYIFILRESFASGVYVVVANGKTEERLKKE